MAANLNITYSEMTAAASQLAAGRDEMMSKLQMLQSQIANLVSSGFVTDQASKRFEGAYNEYTSSANTVVEKLTEIQQFLHSTAQSMQEMDAAIAARIN